MQRVLIILSGQGGELARHEATIADDGNCTKAAVEWLMEEGIILNAGDTFHVIPLPSVLRARPEFELRNPTLCEIMREDGHNVEMTGGGCTAWQSYFSDCWTMCTTLDGPDHNIDSQDWLLGIYDQTVGGECGYVMFEPINRQSRSDTDDEVGVGAPGAYRFPDLVAALKALERVKLALSVVNDAHEASIKAVQDVLGETGDFAAHWYAEKPNAMHTCDKGLSELRAYAIAQALAGVPQADESGVFHG